jgi:hypothetical protein
MKISYNNEVEYAARRMCARRAVSLTSIASAVFGGRYDFGVVDNTDLAPVVANTFYILLGLSYSVSLAQTVAGIRIELGSIGAAGASGAIQHQTLMAVGEARQWGMQECSYVRYRVNGNTGGSVNISGTLYQITYS